MGRALRAAACPPGLGRGCACCVLDGPCPGNVNVSATTRVTFSEGRQTGRRKLSWRRASGLLSGAVRPGLACDDLRQPSTLTLRAGCATPGVPCGPLSPAPPLPRPSQVPARGLRTRDTDPCRALLVALRGLRGVGSASCGGSRSLFLTLPAGGCVPGTCFSLGNCRTASQAALRPRVPVLRPAAVTGSQTSRRAAHQLAGQAAVKVLTAPWSPGALVQMGVPVLPGFGRPLRHAAPAGSLVPGTWGLGERLASPPARRQARASASCTSSGASSCAHRTGPSVHMLLRP